eukprot:m.411593 g.411593  ORF g.411593 m.411593 type:complete len:152 (+) comp16816_c0_seq35:1228-1683(+)
MSHHSIPRSRAGSKISPKSATRTTSVASMPPHNSRLTGECESVDLKLKFISRGAADKQLDRTKSPVVKNRVTAEHSSILNRPVQLFNHHVFVKVRLVDRHFADIVAARDRLNAARSEQCVATDPKNIFSPAAGLLRLRRQHTHTARLRISK